MWVIVVLISLILFIQLITLGTFVKLVSIQNKRKGDIINPDNEVHQEIVSHRWKEETKRTVELQCMQVRNAVQKQTIDIHRREISLTPKFLSISSKTLNEVYSPELINVINNFWNAYDSYLKKHWLTEKGDIRSVFKGKSDDKNSEINMIKHHSKELTAQLNQWLTTILED